MICSQYLHYCLITGQVLNRHIISQYMYLQRHILSSYLHNLFITERGYAKTHIITVFTSFIIYRIKGPCKIYWRCWTDTITWIRHRTQVMVFCFVQNFFFRTTRELEYLLFLSCKARIFFSEINIRLYDKNSESYYFFFFHQNQIIFFTNIGNQNMFLETPSWKLNGPSLRKNIH